MHQSSPEVADTAKRPIVIVLAGIAGLDKEKIATDFRKCILEHMPGTPETVVPIFLAEPPELLNIKDFLVEELLTQQGMLEKSYLAISKAIGEKSKDPSTRAIIVPVHLTFMYADQILSPLSWLPRKFGQDQTSLLHAFMRAIRPDLIINLIDDIHYVQSRQKRKGYGLELRDILKWRELEVLVADYMANDVIRDGIEPNETDQYAHSPLVAVRHTRNMLYKYIFEPDTPRLYASYLISEIKRLDTKPVRAKCMTQQVNTLTSALDGEFCLFNPLTIDELPLRNLVRPERGKKKLSAKVIHALATRWLMPDTPSLTRDAVREIKDVSRPELAAVFKPHSLDGKGQVERQVRARDMRLIDQSDAMVVYRPTNKLKPRGGSFWGGGCLEEFRYAQFLMSRRSDFHIYVIVDRKDKPVNDNIGASDGPLSRIEGRITVIKNEELDLDIPEHQSRILEEAIKRIKKDATSITHWRRAVAVTAR